MTSAISSLRRMLLNWPAPPAHTREIIEALLATLARSDADIYTVARIIAPLAPADEYDYRHRAFWQRLNYFCRLYLRSSRWLKPSRMPRPSPNFPFPVVLLWRGIPTQWRRYGAVFVRFAR